MCKSWWLVGQFVKFRTHQSTETNSTIKGPHHSSMIKTESDWNMSSIAAGSTEICLGYFGSYTESKSINKNIKFKVAATNGALNKKKNLFASKLDLNLRKKRLQCYIWSTVLYGAEIWTLREVLKCGAGEGRIRSVGPIVWKNSEVLCRVKGERIVLRTIQGRKANWIRHIFHGNGLLKTLVKER